MKIYFEDGLLRPLWYVPEMPDDIISAENGVTNCINRLECIYQRDPDSIIYTNSIIALNSDYAWNKNENAPNIYVRTESQQMFSRIDTLTSKKLRKAHNLAKMYVAGAFHQMVTENETEPVIQNMTALVEYREIMQELKNAEQNEQIGQEVIRKGNDECDDICCPKCDYPVARNDDFIEMRPKHCPECGTKLIY